MTTTPPSDPTYELRAPDDDLTHAALSTPEGYVGAVSEAVAEDLERLRADLAALRIEHAAQAAVIDGLRATGSMLIRERDEFRTLLQRVVDIERIDAHRAGYTGCKCIARSRAAEQAYEQGRCPHQLADAALAGAKS